MNFQRGGKDFGAEGDGACARWAMVCAAMLLVAVFQGAVCCCQGMSELLCVVVTVLHSACVLVASVDHPPWCKHQAGAVGMSVAGLETGWVLFSSSVVAASQESQTNPGSPPRLSIRTEFPHRKRGKSEK